jgi:processive 1,2-diacylglycerol beta-glucosyltransferase
MIAVRFMDSLTLWAGGKGTIAVHREANMVTLTDKETGRSLGTISDEQLQFLLDQLVEETAADRDYYINRDTLEMFEQEGADASLLDVLRRALGEREEMEIEWSRR